MKNYLDLAKNQKTPLFIYDGDLIEKRYLELYDFFKGIPKLKIFYAMKANFNPDILKLLKDLGSNLDCVSIGEILLAKALGFTQDRLLLTENNITNQEIDEAVLEKVLINFGSISSLTRFGEKYPKQKVAIRINTNIGAGENEKVITGGDKSKFGILLDDFSKVQEIISKYNLKLIGIHKHTGSGIYDFETYKNSALNLLSLTDFELPDLEFIDFGGGFGVPYKKDEQRIDYKTFGAEFSKLLKEKLQSKLDKLSIYFEPGKFLVAESGSLLVQVNTIKDNHSRLIAGVDSGFNHLIRPVLYDAHHQIENLSNTDTATTKKYDICGNICETGDRFAEQREMNIISEGDFLRIKNAGAYCYSMSSFYNLRPLPKEVFVYKNNIKISIKQKTNKQLITDLLKNYE